MRRPLAFSLLLGLGSLSMDAGLNYQNLLSFLPYFIGGHLLPASAWDVLGRRVLRRSLAASFVGTTLSLLLFSAYGGQHFEHAFLASCVNYGCFTGALPNTSEGCANTTQLLLRIVFYVASVPLLAGFFCVLPRRGGFWSYPGYMSMYIYLLHPLIISNPLIMRASFDWLTLAYGRKTNVWDPATAPSAVAIMPCAAPPLHLSLSAPAPLPTSLPVPLYHPAGAPRCSSHCSSRSHQHARSSVWLSNPSSRGSSPPAAAAAAAAVRWSGRWRRLNNNSTRRRRKRGWRQRL